MKDLKNNPTYLVSPNSKVKLENYNTNANLNFNKDEIEKALQDNVEKLSELQEVLYASGKHSLLIVFQAMDAAGKDSTIEHVFSGVNPQGVSVASFKQPSALELSHDFLWRCNLEVPSRGIIKVFNRSHYEEVLVTRVHPQYILGQNIPGIDDVSDIDETFWNNRFKSIANFEEHLTNNGTHILKFFLNVSLDEQKNRFLDRINEPENNWKFSHGDIKERQLWPKYMEAYEQAISHTSTNEAPWYIIPADDKPSMRLLISEIIKEVLNDLNLEFPAISALEIADMEQAKKDLA